MGVQLDHYLDVGYIMSTNTFETLYKIQQSISERWAAGAVGAGGAGALAVLLYMTGSLSSGWACTAALVSGVGCGTCWVHWSRSRAEERRYYGLFMQQATNDLSQRRTWRR